MGTILVVNGPNLNQLGTRQPEIYGTQTLAEIESAMTARAETLGLRLRFFQSNSEGALIDFLQQHHGTASGLIINPGALSHYSYALYDCLVALSLPVIEVHLSNLHARERFRHTSVTMVAAKGAIIGLGLQGYLLALDYLSGR